MAKHKSRRILRLPATISAPGLSNITVQKGTVRGFLVAVQLVDRGSSAGHAVEGIRADRSTGQGISVAGGGMRVRRNQVLNETFSTGTTFGIIVPFSQDVLVVNNRITRTTEGVT